MANDGAQNFGGSARVALVTGASKGLGRACAEALAAAGHRLVICARHLDAVEETAAALRAGGAAVVAVQTDVSIPGDVERLYATVDREYGRLDVLVANSGGPAPGAFMEVPDEQWEQAFEQVLMSAVRSIRLAVARMQPARYGRIVVIGSSSVRQPVDRLVLSNAFRPALLGMVKSLAQDVAPDDITVNLVGPGRLQTERVDAVDEAHARSLGLTPQETRARVIETIPAGHYGRPEDLAALVAFLASEAAGYITGQSILVDGGMVSALP